MMADPRVEEPGDDEAALTEELAEAIRQALHGWVAARNALTWADDAAHAVLPIIRKREQDAAVKALQDVERLVAGIAPPNYELNPHTGIEDPLAAAWVEGLRDASNAIVGFRARLGAGSDS
jgi:hypothetical protein